MFNSVNLKDYMLRNPITARADDDVFKVINEIMQHKVSGVCVVDDDGFLVGVMSEMDCLKAILSSVYNKTPVGLTEEFMTKEVVSVSLSDNIVDVAADMLASKHRRRPVVDENNKLIGLISCRQLLNAVKDFADS